MKRLKQPILAILLLTLIISCHAAPQDSKISTSTTEATTPKPKPSTSRPTRPPRSTTRIPRKSSTTTRRTTTTPPPTTPSIPEGFYDSTCNTTFDCQPNHNFQCREGLCVCPEEAVFDVREQHCIIPLGHACDSELPQDESNCPEFSECFMDRCVCKTGYSMYTMTRCKSDMSNVEEASESRKAPKHQEGNCDPHACDETIGLQCQVDGSCRCKDSKALFVEEFGRCISANMQKTLKDALELMTSSEDDIKSFVHLLGHYEDKDQDQEGSDHEDYHKPINQILEMLRSKDDDEEAPTRLTPSRLYRGDLHASAQEPAESTAAADGTGKDADKPSSSRQSRPRQPPRQPTRQPPRQDPIPDDREPLTYGQQSREDDRDHDDRYHLPLDNIHQSQEPVTRHEPGYAHQSPHHGEGIPLDGYGVIPEGTHHFNRVPHGYHHDPYLHGYGHHGGYHPYGLGHHGGHHSPLHHDLHHRPHKGGPILEMAEILGKSFKLVDKFLPLIFVINDALKKEGIVGKKTGGLLDGHRGHRDAVSKEDIIKEGAMLAGFTKFIALLLRLKKRLDLLGGTAALKKLLT